MTPWSRVSPTRACNDAVRQAVGPDIHLLHHVHHRLTPIEAARLGKSLEPVHLFWMEDATRCGPCRRRHRPFAGVCEFERGFMHCGEVIGHGVEIDEKLAAEYPYQRAYLPVNRPVHDGTLWNW